MARTPLAQKYRPLLFKDVLDQEHIVTVLKNLIREGRYTQPLLFFGPHGVGKTSLARIYARTLLCKNRTPDIEPCNECDSCKSFFNETNLSFQEIDAASNSGVDDIREMRDNAKFRSLGEFDQRILLIDECHAISAAGNKALFKQLEDNIDDQIYLFCTTAVDSMAPEIRSRCFELPIYRVSKESILKKLKEICILEKIEHEDSALDLIAETCQPHVRDAIKKLDYFSNYGEITYLLVYNQVDIKFNEDCLQIIKNIKGDIRVSLTLVDLLLQKLSVPDIYSRIIDSIIKCQKLSYGLNSFINDKELSISKEVISIYNANLFTLLDTFLSRNIYATPETLRSDILILNKRLGITPTSSLILDRIDVQVTPLIPAPTTPTMPIAKSEVAAKESIPPVSDIGCGKKEDIADETSDILQRYKGYSPQLAILMSKSKNSGLVNTSTSVKLVQDVKELKSNIPKNEIKKIVEDRGKFWKQEKNGS